MRALADRRPVDRSGDERAALVSDRGERIALAVDRWHTDADAVERALLAAVPDPVLDVGCGPGRMVAALVAEGRIARGVAGLVRCASKPDAIARRRSSS